MKAILREGDNLLKYSNPERIVKTASWDILKEQLTSGKTWVGYIPYEMGEVEACFFDARSIAPYFEEIQFHIPDLKCVKPFDSEITYKEKVKSIQEEILDGDVYQVNLSHETAYRGKIDPLALFLKLSHNPFAAYFDDGKKQLISSSPEKLLTRTDSTIESCPIKGTAPFGKAVELLASSKDAAELNMITDLIRSDMSWIANIESPKLISEKTLTTYPHIHHLHSIIQAKSDLHPIDCIKALFPGGSITGCPKISAMKTIKSLENRQRGIYTGSMGVIKPNGDFQFNISIRTLTYENDILSWALGGGVTIDSDPKAEYLETLAKGKEIALLLGL